MTNDSTSIPPIPVRERSRQRVVRRYRSLGFESLEHRQLLSVVQVTSTHDLPFDSSTSSMIDRHVPVELGSATPGERAAVLPEAAEHVGNNLNVVHAVPAAYEDDESPTVVSIVRAEDSAPAGSSLEWIVTFSEPVLNVDGTDFRAVPGGGVTHGAITATAIPDSAGGEVTGTTYRAVASNVSGVGTLRLDLSDDDSIISTQQSPLGGAGTENGDFTGETYSVDASPPVVNTIERLDPDPTTAASVRFRVSFNERVTGVNNADFLPLITGSVAYATMAVDFVPQVDDYYNVGHQAWIVTFSSISGSGTLRLNLSDDDSIRNRLDLPLGGIGSENGDFSGPTYRIDRISPVVQSITRMDPDPTGSATLRFAVAFSEAVSEVGAGDFELVRTGTVQNDTVLSITGEGASYVVTVSGVAGEGTLGLNLLDDDSIVDEFGNLLTGQETSTGDFEGEVYTIHQEPPHTPPVVQSIARMDANPTSAESVRFLVTFSSYVYHVDATDFLPLVGGSVTYAGISLRPSEGSNYYYPDYSHWIVTFSGLQGEGMLRLNLVDDDSIVDSQLAPLGGTGPTNGNFAGEAYQVDRVSPRVVSIVRTDANPTSGPLVRFTVTFSESVIGVNTSDFALVTTGSVDAAGPISVTGSGTEYLVTVAGVSGEGTLGLNLVDDDSIRDRAELPLRGEASDDGSLTGEIYQVDAQPPRVRSIARESSELTVATTLTWLVTFSEPVMGVDRNDFQPIAGGEVSFESWDVTPVTSDSVATGSTTYRVSVRGIQGGGTLGLNLNDDDSVHDRANTLAGEDSSDGSFTGEVYSSGSPRLTVAAVLVVDGQPATDGNLSVAAGKSVTLRFVVSNTGNVPLANVVLTDDGGTPLERSDDLRVNLPGTLAPGETRLYEVPATAAAGLQTRTVLASIAVAVTDRRSAAFARAELSYTGVSPGEPQPPTKNPPPEGPPISTPPETPTQIVILPPTLPFFLSRVSAHIGSASGFAPMPVRPAMVDRAVRPASSVLPQDEPLLLGALGSTDVASSDLVDAASDTSQLREEKPSAFRGHVAPPSSPPVTAPGTATGGIRWSVLLASAALCGAMLTLYVSRRRGQGPSWLVRRWGSWRRKTAAAPPAAKSAPGATP